MRAETVRQGRGDEMTDLLTAMHLSVVLLDLKIKMMQAIEDGQFEYAMTLKLNPRGSA